MATLHDLWMELQATGTGGSQDGLSLRLLHAGQDVRLYAAVSVPGNLPALVVEIPNAHRPRDLARISTRTFEAVLAHFPGLPSGRSAISILLRQADYTDLFELLGIEIVGAISRSSSSAEACRGVVRCIERWRRFMERSHRSLTEEEVRGLIGEITVLSRCIGRFGPAAAVNSWQGPTGGLRDFELADFAVEVKTYQAETGAAVRINDPQQLEGVPERPTYMCVVRLARTQLQGKTLPEFIGHAEELLRQDAEAMDGFRDRLAVGGYLAAQAAQYAERYLASRVQMFKISAGFPRIASGAVPPGVRDVHFSIELTAMSAHVIEAADLLGTAGGLEGE